MPMRAGRPCPVPGCKAVVRSGYCPQHKRPEAARRHRESRAFERERGSAAARGYGANWRKTRARFLADNPLCAVCLLNGRTTAATEVDHIIPHQGDQYLFNDPGNLQALCKPCHSRKTATEVNRRQYGLDGRV